MNRHIRLKRRLASGLALAFFAIPVLVFHTRTEPVRGQPAQGGGLKEQVAKGVSPEDWLNGLRKERGGNWDETEKASAPMAQILRVATDAVSEASKSGTDCKRAAGGVGFGLLFDAYSTVGLKGLLDAVKTAIKTIWGLGKVGVGEKEFEEWLKDRLKDKGKEWIKNYVHERLAKGKPEVFVSKVKKGNCRAVLVSIWDRAAESYEVLVYGDCGCTPQTTWTERGAARLGTFAVRVKGKVTVGVDFDKNSPVLNVYEPPTEVTVESNCAACNKPATGTTAPKPETTDQPAVDPCTLKPPCKECTELYDRITAGCKRLKEIDAELTRMTGEPRAREENKNYLKKRIAQLEAQGAAAADELKARREELKEVEREAREIELQGYRLGLEAQELKKNLKDLARQLKECERTRCGKAPATPTPTPTPTPTTTGPVRGLDPCLIGVWRSQTLGEGTDQQALTGVVLTYQDDGTISIDYNGMQPIRGGYDGNTTIKWSGAAVGRFNPGGNSLATVVRSDVTETYTDYTGTPQKGIRYPALGPASPPSSGYFCDATALRYTSASSIYSFTFKRFGTTPR